MNLRNVALTLGAVGTGLFVYGALVEAKRLVVDRHTLPLEDWPERLRGYKIALLTDFHIGSKVSIDLCKRSIAMALDESPDMIAIAGDFVEDWSSHTAQALEEAMEWLLLMNANVVAVPGNHDYYGIGDADLLEPICDRLNIKLLRNQSWRHDGITWVGIDSEHDGHADPAAALNSAEDGPRVVLWHEPDMVEWMPRGCALQLSGHSHGGQFRFPLGITPMHTRNGRKYPRGFYPDAPTPLYVSRGVGTTLLPTRMLCAPEVSLLTLVPRESGS